MFKMNSNMLSSSCRSATIFKMNSNMLSYSCRSAIDGRIMFSLPYSRCTYCGLVFSRA